MFNQRLRMLRESSGMKQKEVAEKIGISYRVYSYYENDRFPKDEDTIKKIVECFDCSADYLLGISEFRNYEEIKKIRENTTIFKQIQDPVILENMKGIFNTLADISKSDQEKNYAVTHCLDTVVDSIHGIFSSYYSSIEGAEDSAQKGLQNLKFLEFKAFSTEKIDSVQESIKVMANDLANKIKESFEQDDDKISL